MFWSDSRAFAVSAREQPFEIRHDITAFGFGRLMATLAIRLEDRTDLPVITDLRDGFGIGFLFNRRDVKRSKKSHRDKKARRQARQNAWHKAGARGSFHRVNKDTREKRL